MPDPTRDRELRELVRDFRNYFEYLAGLGLKGWPRVTIKAEEYQPVAVVETLEDIRRDLGDCTRCPLHRGRTHLVFGEGNPRAELMFVGEAPGEDEDRQGRPFVGRSGQLLTDIIVKGLKMRREDVYIANVVKCRPPKNRDPLPEEAQTCLPFLHRQIRAVRPKVICALGKVAANYLLETTEPLSKLRRRFHDLEGIPVMPTYHPSFLLRQPEMKREAWEDVKLIIARLRQDNDQPAHS